MTNSNTLIIDERGKPILNMYRTSEGYLNEHGAELKKHFGDVKIINGISTKIDNSKNANGMECLAAQIVAHFKKGIGDVYLHEVVNENKILKDCSYYTYILYNKNGMLYCKVYSWKSLIYDGALNNLPDEEPDEKPDEETDVICANKKMKNKSSFTEGYNIALDDIIVRIKYHPLSSFSDLEIIELLKKLRKK